MDLSKRWDLFLSSIGDGISKVWIIVTGVASIFSYVCAPSNIDIGLNKVVIMATISLSGIVFLSYHLWMMSGKFIANNKIEVIEFQNCDDYIKDGYVCVLAGDIPSFEGTLMELRIFVNGIEVPFALVEIMEQNSKNYYQGRVIWVAPIHIRDFKCGTHKVANMNACLVKYRTVEKAMNY